MSTIGNWINKNITGNRGSGYVSDKEARQLDQQGSQLKDDINNIKDTVDHLSEPVQVSVEGSYKNLSTKDKFVLGAAGGAAVGGTLGAVKGMLDAAGDAMNPKVEWETHKIIDPKVTGVETVKQDISGKTTVATADGLKEMETSGASVRYHFEPKIEYKEIGEYKTPKSIDGKFAFTTNSVIEGAKGAAMGAVVGVAGTAAYVALDKIRHKDEGEEKKEAVNVNYGDDTKTIIKSGAIGAAVGAGVGLVDATWEKLRTGGEQVIKWEVPKMETGVKIGEVPQDASVMIRQDVKYAPDAFKDSQLYNDPSKFDLEKHMKHAEEIEVKGDRPDKNLLGQVKMEEKSQAVTSEARYGVVGTVLGGAVLGGVIGVASGVAMNVLKKMVNS